MAKNKTEKDNSDLVETLHALFDKLQRGKKDFRKIESDVLTEAYRLFLETLESKQMKKELIDYFTKCPDSKVKLSKKSKSEEILEAIVKIVFGSRYKKSIASKRRTILNHAFEMQYDVERLTRQIKLKGGLSKYYTTLAKPRTKEQTNSTKSKSTKNLTPYKSALKHQDKSNKLMFIEINQKQFKKLLSETEEDHVSITIKKQKMPGGFYKLIQVEDQ